MASGEPVVQILEIWPTTTLFATLVRRAETGTAPVSSALLWAFDAAANWYLDFLCVLRGYGGGGLTFTLPWTATSATTGVTRWGIGVHRLQSGGDDYDTQHTYDYNEVDATAPGTSGVLLYTDITFTDGADMDSWAAGELAILRVQRNATHANDNMSGDAQLWTLLGRET